VLKLANLALASPGHESNVRFKLIAARERTFRIPPIRTVISGSTGFHVTHAPAGQFSRRGELWDNPDSTRQRVSGGPGMPGEWSVPNGR